MGKSKSGHVRARFGVLAVVTSAILLVPTPALAVGLVMSPNATIVSGQSRVISAAWGFAAPYSVNFQCNVAGCLNFVNGSTNVESLARTVQLWTCTGVQKTSTISVTESGGASISGSSRTTWTAGSVC